MKNQNNQVIAEIEDLYFYKNNKVILENINFQIKIGQIINIIGPNGAGKSSLIKIICGIKPADRGLIKLAKTIKLDYLPQKIHLNSEFPITVIDFLRLSSNMDKKLFEHLSDIFNIRNLYNNLLTELSGGELQKIYLVRVLASKSHLLLLDEPVQYLDIDGQLQFYLAIEDLCSNHGKSALIVSHDVNVVMKSSQQIICLNKHICCQGKAEDIKNSEDFSKLFGNKLDKVMAPYKHHHDHSHSS